MSKPLYDDPVVAEIHAIRAKMLADCEGDSDRLFQETIARQESGNQTIIRTPLEKPDEADATINESEQT